MAFVLMCAHTHTESSKGILDLQKQWAKQTERQTYRCAQTAKHKKTHHSTMSTYLYYIYIYIDIYIYVYIHFGSRSWATHECARVGCCVWMVHVQSVVVMWCIYIWTLHELLQNKSSHYGTLQTQPNYANTRKTTTLDTKQTTDNKHRHAQICGFFYVVLRILGTTTGQKKTQRHITDTTKGSTLACFNLLFNILGMVGWWYEYVNIAKHHDTPPNTTHNLPNINIKLQKKPKKK